MINHNSGRWLINGSGGRSALNISEEQAIAQEPSIIIGVSNGCGGQGRHEIGRQPAPFLPSDNDWLPPAVLPGRNRRKPLLQAQQRGTGLVSRGGQPLVSQFGDEPDRARFGWKIKANLVVVDQNARGWRVGRGQTPPFFRRMTPGGGAADRRPGKNKAQPCASEQRCG